MHLKSPSNTQSWPQRGSNRNSGFSLLEVLIALVILSIGLLGLAGLQATSLQNNRDAAQASQANFLAQDIIDRIRANPGAARDGNYNVNFGETDDDYDANGSVAEQDLDDWLGQMENAIPGSTSGDCGNNGASPCGANVTVAGNDTVTISIRWSSNSRNRDGETRFTTESQL